MREGSGWKGRVVECEASMLQKAKIKDVSFVPDPWEGFLCAYGVCVEHPRIQVGHRILTSRVLRHTKKGFTTENTRYTIVKERRTTNATGNNVR